MRSAISISLWTMNSGLMTSYMLRKCLMLHFRGLSDHPGVCKKVKSLFREAEPLCFKVEKTMRPTEFLADSVYTILVQSVI